MNVRSLRVFVRQRAVLLSKLGLITLLVSGGLYVRLKPAQACSCLRPASPLEEREQATAVFSAEVLAIRPGDQAYGDRRVDLRVSEQWKGDLSETLTIATADNSAACGYRFEVGEQYLIYANGELDDLSVNLCSRTTLLARANEDIAEFVDNPLMTEESSPESDLPEMVSPETVSPETDSPENPDLEPRPDCP